MHTAIFRHISLIQGSDSICLSHHNRRLLLTLAIKWPLWSKGLDPCHCNWPVEWHLLGHLTPTPHHTFSVVVHQVLFTFPGTGFAWCVGGKYLQKLTKSYENIKCSFGIVYLRKLLFSHSTFGWLAKTKWEMVMVREINLLCFGSWRTNPFRALYVHKRSKI